MSRVCEICGKGKMPGCTVSFSNRKANRQYEVNLQSTTVEIDGKLKKVKACTKCKKTLAKYAK
ncbi:MAG: 50S ribosomal protein L28 [Clostridia bacterium]